MRKSGIFGALAIAFALGAPPSAVAQNCQLKLVNTIPIKMMAGGARPIVTLTLNGVDKPFLLDTGGAATQVGLPTVEELKLPTREWNGKMMDLYGNVSNHFARVDTLKLGMASDRNTDLPILTSTFSGNKLFAGLLAADYMASYDVELDFGGGKMNFFSKDHCEGKVVYWNAPGAAVVPMLFRDHHINIPVMLNGKPFKAIVDTGAPGVTLLAPEAKRAFDLTKDSPGVILRDSGPEPRSFEYVFDSLSFEGISVSKPRVGIIPDLMGKNDPNNHLVTGTRLQRVNNRDSSQATMLIGMSVLSKLRIFIAFSENKLYITPATSPVTVSD